MVRILLVDDDDSFRPMLQEMLERSGFAVDAVRSGNEALAHYRESAADLVITDLIMPDKEGLEVIRELRQEAPAVKIIAMSGGGRTSSSTYLQLARRLGAAKVLSKPFSQQELVDAIAAALAGK